MGAELFYVLVGSVAVAAFARWRGLPAPLVVTAVALAVSFIPFVPDIEIDGELLLMLTLPPLLYSAALDASFTSFAQSLPHVRRLGVGLVAVTAVVVGVVAWLMIPDLSFAGALLLGAIVGPPDAVSAAAIGRKLGLPRRVMNVLSGESLINDATSLTLVRVFAAIVAGATVTVWQGLGEFALAVVVGVAIGAVFGVALHWLRMHFDDATVATTFGLLMPFGAYAIAEHLEGSGVLAVVAMGFYVGYNQPRTSYTQRQQDKPLWHAVDLLLESFVFAYVGLQLPGVIRTITETSGGGVLLAALAVFAAVLVTRPVFVFISYWWGQAWEKFKLRRWKRAVEQLQNDPDDRRRRQMKRRAARAEARRRLTGRAKSTPEAVRRRVLEPKLSWQERVVISWAGMRGVVTLALAAALPHLTNHAMAEGEVELLIAIAFVVTLGTLLLQGLTLPALIRGLKVSRDAEHEHERKQVARVRRISRQAGLDYLQEQQRKWVAEHGEAGEEMFKRFSRGLLRVERDEKDAEELRQEARDAAGEPAQDPVQPGRSGTTRPERGGVRQAELVALMKGWIDVRRSVLLEQMRAGNLSEEVMRELFAAMDAEELALDTRGGLAD